MAGISARMARYLLPVALLLGSSVALAQEPQPDRYGVGETVRAEFSLSERSREGGRLTAFFTSYRPDISFEGGEVVTCRFETDAEGGHRPGTTGEIGMTCPVAVSEGQQFEAFERKRPVGSGVVLPRAPG